VLDALGGVDRSRNQLHFQRQGRCLVKLKNSSSDVARSFLPFSRQNQGPTGTSSRGVFFCLGGQNEEAMIYDSRAEERRKVRTLTKW
jgi:hypothetical protein